MGLKDYRNQLKEQYKDDISIGTDSSKFVFSTGVFSLDKALGGGIPRGRCILTFGPEASSKTTLAMKTAASAQLHNWDTNEIDPTYTNPTPVVFVDLEGTFDPTWASKHGLQDDPDYFLLIRPSAAEQAIDIVNDLIVSGQAGLIILDSLEAMVPKAEDDRSTEDSKSLGERAKLIALAYRKWNSSLTKIRARNEEQLWKIPTLFAINQLREKIGVMFGPNTTIPGGRAQHFYSSVKISLNTAKIKDDSTAQYGVATFDGVVEKNKLAAPKRKFAYEMTIVDTPDSPAGTVDNAGAILKYLKSSEMVTKGTDGGWDILGVNYRTQKEFEEKLKADKVFYQKTVSSILSNTPANVEVEECEEEN
jgi:recombination protein RecA